MDLEEPGHRALRARRSMHPQADGAEVDDLDVGTPPSS
jgi:hypothetical protein